MRANKPPVSIPSYNLYGEMGDFPDIVHCEAIATRSRLHDWHIEPHRHARLHQFFILYTGGGECKLAGSTIPLAPPQIISIPARTPHGFTFHAGTRGWVVTIPLDVIDAGLDTKDGVRNILAVAAELPADASLSELFENIAHEHSHRDYARAHILRSLIMLTIGRIARLLSDRQQDANKSNISPLFHRFENLVEEHYRDHWRIADYADALGITPTHLGRLVRRQIGFSASKVIEDRLVREARGNLAYTSASVSEIAYALGFSDPAYFTRVFTRATGWSPSAFRAQLELR